MRASLSVAMICYNSERTLDKTLNLVETLADEIIIIDSYSTDATKEIAKKYGAQIIDKDFTGFSSQKQFAIDHCTSDWILLLDDDEYIQETLAKSIREGMQTEEALYGLPRSLYFMNYKFWIGSEHKIPTYRLFPRGEAFMNQKAVHEELYSSLPKKKLRGEMLHDSFASYDACIQKLDRYAKLFAESSEKKCSAIYPYLRGAFAFFQTYFLKLNFLNLKAGYYWSRAQTFYQYKKYKYLWELNQ